jgi:two-component system, response regulator
MNEKTILIVEDNPDDFALIVRAMKKNNFEYNLAHSGDGEEARDYLHAINSSLNSAAKLPDLIVLDLKLPKIDGLELLKIIRSIDSTKYIPVVVLTSSIEQKDLMESYRYGANSYIRKPVNFDEFIELISNLCSYWLRLNIFPQHKILN